MTVRACLLVAMSAWVFSCAHLCVRACMRTRSYVAACTFGCQNRACVSARSRAACVRVRMDACAPSCVRACAASCVYACVHALLGGCVFACMRAPARACGLVRMCAYVHA
eukprot:5725329-Pleurochrysis_carterae.AAC.1